MKSLYILDSQVRARINEVRCLPSKEKHLFEKMQEILRIVSKTIANLCDMFYDEFYTYIFVKSIKKLIKVDKENQEYQKLMSSTFDLNPTEKESAYVLAGLRTFIRLEGDRITVRQQSYYDPTSNTIYIDKFDDKIVKVTANAVEVVNNGTDGVLFLSDPSNEAWDLVPLTETEHPLFTDLIDQINFKPDGLTRAEYQLLFKYCLLAMFLRSMMATRPISVFKGEKGSGKTFGLKMIGTALHGSKFSPTQMTNDPKDFDAAVTNSPYIVIDNLDTYYRWLLDRLAIIATGGALKKRELYTTNTMVTFVMDCFLFITSRDPKFLRDDIADRVILFNLDRFDKFTAEKKLIKAVLNNRNKIMSDIVRELQIILKALEAQKDYEVSTPFRIADFAELMIKVEREAGREAAAVRILDMVSKVQAKQVLENDPMLSLLMDWIEDNQGKEISTKSLCEALARQAKALNIPFSIATSTRVFGRRLKALVPSLEPTYKATSRTGGQGTVYYTFAKGGK